MNCECGHRERDHGLGWRSLLLLVGLLAGSATVSTAEVAAPPESFAHVARAARAASIVLRVPEIGTAFESAPADEEQDEVLDPLAPIEAIEPIGRRTIAAGVIVDPRGFAVTSARAVERWPAFEVALVDGTPVDAVLLAIDRRSDIAVLKLEPGPTPLPFLPFGDSDRIAMGEWIIAITAPLGLEGTVTAGVITALPRTTDPDPLAGFLQTDASLGPGSGSAGGPLVSTNGDIVGLGVGFRTGGLGYARPSNLVRKIYLELVERGRVLRPWLGVSTQTLTTRLARALGALDATGVLIADVSAGGPAAGAGLRSGDIVVAVDAMRVSSRAQLERAVSALVPGRTVTLSVRRAAATLSVRVTLGQEPDESQRPVALAQGRRLLGIQAAPLTPTMGVVTADVEAASPAGHAGLEPGDILREVNHRPMRTIRDFEVLARSLDPRASVLILVQRADVALYVVIDPLR
jgi:serine protease Do